MRWCVAFFILTVTFSISALADPRLTGAWGSGDDVLYRFKADGTGETEGERFRWKAAKGILTITADGESEEIPYRIEGNSLILSAGFFPLELERLGKGPGKQARAGAHGPAASGEPRRDNSDNLSRLLLSSAWCTFSYNQISGSSKSTRVQFFPNGTWSDSSRAEGYSSGYGGSMASQHDSGGSGRWKTKGGQLYLSGPDGNLESINLQVNHNSNGYPVIKADGVEYSQCD
jgi:hypothetical protein